MTSVWSVGNLKTWALIWCNKRRSGRKIFRGRFLEEQRTFLRIVNRCLVSRNDVLWIHRSIVWWNSVDIMMRFWWYEYEFVMSIMNNFLMFKWMYDAINDDFWRYYDDGCILHSWHKFLTMVASIPLCGLKFLMFVTAP